MSDVEMTPLQMAIIKEKEPKPCKECEKSVRIKNILYCELSGKIILPMFENISICRGERVKENKHE